MANNQPIGVAYSDPALTSATFAPVLVAALPAASSAIAGMRMVVTDATLNTFGSSVVGGGTYFMPVLCNGTAWVIG